MYWPPSAKKPENTGHNYTGRAPHFSVKSDQNHTYQSARDPQETARLLLSLRTDVANILRLAKPRSIAI